MQPIPYLFFRGTAEEAVRAYARIFNSPDPQIMHVGDAPESMPGAQPHHVMHAAVQIGDGMIYASDYADATDMAGTCIAVTGKTPEESRRMFDALKEGGVIQMELQPTFWSPAFGQLTDRWGTRWMVDTENPAHQAAAE
jgi:PhnB protein